MKNPKKTISRQQRDRIAILRLQAFFLILEGCVMETKEEVKTLAERVCKIEAQAGKV